MKRCRIFLHFITCRSCFFGDRIGITTNQLRFQSIRNDIAIECSRFLRSLSGKNTSDFIGCIATCIRNCSIRNRLCQTHLNWGIFYCQVVYNGCSCTGSCECNYRISRRISINFLICPDRTGGNIFYLAICSHSKDHIFGQLITVRGFCFSQDICALGQTVDRSFSCRNDSSLRGLSTGSREEFCRIIVHTFFRTGFCHRIKLKLRAT